MNTQNRCAWPLDGGLRYFDAQPLRGSSRAVRGVLGAILVTALAGIATSPVSPVLPGAGGVV